MGKYTTLAIKVPDINRSFTQGNYKYSDKSTISSNTALLNQIISNYSGFIETWGTEFEIDNSIIAGFIATESLELIARMTEEGCGYGIIPERTVKLLGLNIIQVPDTPTFVDKFSVVYRPEFGKSKYEKTLIDVILRIFK